MPGRLLGEAEGCLKVNHWYASAGLPILLAVDEDVGGARPVGPVVLQEARSDTAGTPTGLCGKYLWKVNDNSFKLVPVSCSIQFTTSLNVVVANSNAPAAVSAIGRH